MARKNRNARKIPPVRNKHHIRPKSRCTCHKGENIVVICAVKHAEYHELFGNMLPNEVVKFLVEYYWKNQWHWVHQAIKENDHESDRDDHL